MPPPINLSIAGASDYSKSHTWGAAHTFSAGLSIEAAQGITMGEDSWIGRGPTSYRIVFDDTEKQIHLIVPDDIAGAGIRIGNSDGHFFLSNNTGATDKFYPRMMATAKGADVPVLLGARTNDDTGTVGVMRFSVDRDTDSPITTRPAYEWWNYNVKLLELSADGNLVMAGSIDLNPAITSGFPNRIIDITNSTAIGANTHWTGLRIDGSNLDPAGTDTKVRGIALDFADIIPGDAAYEMDLDALRIIMPASSIDDAIRIRNGKVRYLFTTTTEALAYQSALDITIDASVQDTTSETHALDVALSNGLVGDVAALGTHLGIDPIHQHVGTYNAITLDALYIEGTGYVSFDADENIWAAKLDALCVGHTTKFDEIELSFDTTATKDCFLKFYYWKNLETDAWIQFYPEDDTDGGRQDGIIRFDGADLVDWLSADPTGQGTGYWIKTGQGTGYWIKIERNRTNNPGTVNLASHKYLVATTYYWDKVGALSIGSLSTTGKGTFGSNNQFVIGDDANSRAGYVVTTSYTATLGDDSTPQFLNATDSTRNVILLDSEYGLHVDDAGVGSNVVELCNATRALTVTGDSLFTGGNVGIGTASPAQALDVAGYIRTVQTVNQDTIPSVDAQQTASTLQDGSAFTGVDTTVSTQYIAVKFTASEAHTMGDFTIRIKESADIINKTAYIRGYIYADDGGSPSKPTGSALATGSGIKFGAIEGSYQILSVGTSYTMVEGTDYWLVLKWSAVPAGGNIVLDSDTSSNMGATSADGIAWTNTNVRLRYVIRGETYHGVQGISANNRGVHGESVNSYGVYGSSANSYGVRGISTNAYGVYGSSANSYGVRGISTNSYGVYGTSTNSYGVYGTSITNRAGYFFRNNTAGTATTAVVDIVQDSATAETNTVLRVQGDGTGDLVNIFDGGTEVFTILDGGNVGIGTTGPDLQLEINTGAATGGIRLTYNDANGSATTYSDMLVNSDGFLTLNPTGNAIYIGGGASATELRFLEPSGSGTNFTAIKAQAQGGNITYTLPSALGNPGDVLTDAGATGTLSWAAPQQTPWGQDIDAAGYNLNSAGKGTFGSTYQAKLGDDGNYKAAHFYDETYSAEIANGSQAGYFYDGTRYAYLADGSQAGYFDNGSYVVHLAENSDALQAEDGTNTTILCDDNYAINFYGDIYASNPSGSGTGFTGTLYDGASNAIADVVSGIITGVY